MTRFIFSGMGFLSAALSLLASSPADASDLLIWSPVRTAPHAYQTTIGFQLPMQWETSAGADIGLAGLPGGKIESGSELATVWGKITDDRNTFDGSVSRAVALRLDPLRGSTALIVSRSRNWIYSENLDVGLSHSLNVNYAANASEATASLNASQALTMTYPWTGTAITASGTLADAKAAFTGSLAFDQPIAPNLTLNASLTDPMSSSQSGDVRVNYQLKW
jgi:hypothetical protein